MEFVADFKVETLEKLVGFSKGLHVKLDSVQEILELYEAARSYKYKSLEVRCVEEIVCALFQQGIKNAELIQIHDFAIKYNISRLISFSGQEICNRGVEIFDCEELKYVSFQAMCSILQLNIIGATETDIFRAALSFWAARHCGRGLKNSEQIKQFLFKSVRFELMDLADLTTIVHRSCVFTSEQYTTILHHVLASVIKGHRELVRS